MKRILVVEDEDKMRRLLARGLADEGFDVVAVADGNQGLELATGDTFDCVILDMMLPGRDGSEILAAMRARGVMTPVVVLSARGSLDDRVGGLDLGADDYVAKPFAWAELAARVRACLRRGTAEAQGVVRCGHVHLDCLRRRLSHNGCEAELTVRECELLEFLFRHPNVVLSREELAREIWHDPAGGMTNITNVYINYVRKKLEKVGAAGLIETVRGAGYRVKG